MWFSREMRFRNRKQKKSLTKIAKDLESYQERRKRLLAESLVSKKEEVSKPE